MRSQLRQSGRGRRWPTVVVGPGWTERVSPSRSAGEDWEATASFRLGVLWQQEEDYERSQTYYAQALARRPDHEPALHNLAVCDVRLGHYEAAAHHLGRLIRRLDDRHGDQWGELRYTATYNRVLTERYRLMEARDEGEGTRAIADQAADLASRLLRRLNDLEQTQGAAAESERAALNGLEGVTVMLAAGSIAAIDPVAVADAVMKQARERLDLVLQEAEGALPYAPPLSVPTSRRLALMALEVAQRSIKSAPKQRAPQPAVPALLEDYVRERTYSHRRVLDSLDRRTLYNLACFRSRLAGAVSRTSDASAVTHRVDALLEPAWRDLELALEDGSLRVWASNDPALKTLGDSPRFGRLTARTRAQIEAEP